MHKSPCCIKSSEFNVLAGNSDAHLKNLSFMVSHEGVQLAPFYDLLSIATYDSPAFEKKGWPEQTQLAWPILGVRHFSSITRSVLLEAGAVLNLKRGTADRVLESLRGRVVAEAQALCAEVEAENAEIVRQRPELASTVAGEIRCVRAIVHTVLKERVKQISA